MQDRSERDHTETRALYDVWKQGHGTRPGSRPRTRWRPKTRPDTPDRPDDGCNGSRHARMKPSRGSDGKRRCLAAFSDSTHGLARSDAARGRSPSRRTWPVSGAGAGLPTIALRKANRLRSPPDPSRVTATLYRPSSDVKANRGHCVDGLASLQQGRPLGGNGTRVARPTRLLRQSHPIPGILCAGTGVGGSRCAKRIGSRRSAECLT